MTELNGEYFIELGGKNRGLKFGMGAFYICSKLNNLHYHELFDQLTKPTQGLIIDLIYSALAFYAEDKGQRVDFNASNVAEWVGLHSVTNEDIIAIINKVYESLNAAAGNDGGSGQTPTGK